MNPFADFLLRKICLALKGLNQLYAGLVGFKSLI